MYIYSAYGLSVHSQLHIPELPEQSPVSTDANVAVVVRVDRVTNTPLESGQSGSWFNVSPRKSFLVWAGVGTYLINDGREVIIDPAARADEALVRQAFLGPAMGLLLQQRGFFPLHASSLAIAGRGVALAGVRRSGKSTLAAHLHSRGHELVSDDITAVVLGGDPFMIHPGFPRFRLWPEVVSSFGKEAAELPRLHDETEKRLLSIDSGFAGAPVPFDRVYFLAEDRVGSIEPLTARDGVLELLKLCYNTQIIQTAIGPPALLNQCASLAARIGLYILKRPLTFETLPAVGDMVEEHLAQSG